MRFYYFPNTIAVATAIGLEEAGLAYDPVMVNFAQAEQTKAPYHAVNPKGRVPALDVDGTILTETGAILDWIAATVPDKNLMPADPFDAARARSVMYYVASTMHVNHAHKMRGARWADNEASFADMRAKIPETMTASAQYVETHCLEGPYILGDSFCLADAYLFAVCNWLEGDGVKVSDFPRITAFLDTMEGRASVIAVRGKGILK